jgi:hypothetical protein
MALLFLTTALSGKLANLAQAQTLQQVTDTYYVHAISIAKSKITYTFVSSVILVMNYLPCFDKIQC